MLADRLEVPFYEGDDFHPPENIAKISRGEGLSADDRRPWISTISKALNADAAPISVLACSALNAVVRDQLCEELRAEARFVLLDVPPEELLRRLQTRAAHFAGPDLLKSQLEALDAAEEAYRLPADRPADQLATAIADWIQAAPSS
ncbi:gluconokinase [Parvularcula mediterranea]